MVFSARIPQFHPGAYFLKSPVNLISCMWGILLPFGNRHQKLRHSGAGYHACFFKFFLKKGLTN